MMREAAFTRRNEAKWRRLETLVQAREQKVAVDDITNLYIQLTDDLSYARTFYPGSEVTAYLNSLATRLHQHIHQNQRTSSRRFITFWTEEVPLALARSRRELLISFLVFGIAGLIGALSAHYDTTFTRLIMGDYYVNMTLENIKNGKPMDVYGQDHEMDMFFGITLNNIMVSFWAFALGLFVTVGTWYLLISNGIMLGCFQYFMFQQGVLKESLLSIWVHGTIEISSIVVAGAAGTVMGNAILFPGTYSRLESFKRGALRGLKLVIGLVPLFIIAGFLESFVTRHSPDMPVWAACSIIFGSLAFIIAYFIFYPHHVQQRTLRARAPAQAA